jgi:hypothetical protein
MPLTYTYDDSVLTSLLGSTVYLGLSTADPEKDGSGLAEPASGGYARVAVAPADWNTPAGGVVTNSNPIAFAAPSGSWGTPLYFTLHTAGSGGALIAYGALDNIQSVGVGSTAPTFEAGALRVTLD